MQFYASCPPGLETLLIEELSGLGATNLKEHPTHVEFEGDLEVAYKSCLHTRLANRIYLCILNDRFESVDELYQKVNNIEWGWHFDLHHTFSVSCVARRSHLITHSGFGALKVKDAIVDFYQERYEKRPSVDKENPDYRVHAIMNGSQLKIGIDLAGRSLNQRGYRDSSGRAPIKENLAAAMLIRAKWPEKAAAGESFHDPMCGTGTLLIEAAMMASEMAPGLINSRFGFHYWKQHDEEVWQTVLATAKRHFNKTKQTVTNQFFGSDSHGKSLGLAQDNIETAGLSDLITVAKHNIKDVPTLEYEKSGLVLTNPPYGERLGDDDTIIDTYRELGQYLKYNFVGWQAAMITTEQSYAKAIGLRSHKQYKLKNGDLDCQLYLFAIDENNFYTPFDPNNVNPQWEKGLSDGALMLKNRMQKNRKRFKSYLKQNDVSCYRLYDADLPEYAASVDVYEDELYIQEYTPPSNIPEKTLTKRLQEITRVSSGVMQIPEAKMHLNKRKNSSSSQQYPEQSEEGRFKRINEQGLSFYVDLTRYSDTGFFLEQRKMRRMIMAEAKDKHFLNLFAGTGSATAYAAKAGAKTTSIEISKTYVKWSIKNFAANNIPIYGHQFVQADCIPWIERAIGNESFDLIYMDPPIFSNSNRMDGNFDVQEDQFQLIDSVMKLLNKEGNLYFTNNYKKFNLDSKLSERYIIHEITAKTLPIDFQKSRNHHRCWVIKHRE